MVSWFMNIEILVITQSEGAPAFLVVDCTSEKDEGKEIEGFEGGDRLVDFCANSGASDVGCREVCWL